MKKTIVRVEQNPEDIIEKPILAKAIIDISRGVNTLLSSGLNLRAITCLVQNSSGVAKHDIRAVIDSLKNLERDFCK